MKKNAVSIALVAIAAMALTGCSTMQRLGITEDIFADGVELALKREGLEGTITRAQIKEVIAIAKADARLQEIGEEIAQQEKIQDRINEIVEKYVIDGAVVEPSEKPVETTIGDYTPQAGEINTGLWKPVSENNGRLVILLPCTLSVTEVKIVTAAGNEEVGNLLDGRYNGNRKHARFAYQGAVYGANARVVATLADGTVREWTIANGAARTDF